MKTLLTLLMLSILVACFGQTYNLKDFVEIPDPVPGHIYFASGPDFFKYNFIVEVSKGKPIVKAAPELQLPEYSTPDGLFWAINSDPIGVFYYQPNDTTQKVIKVNNKQDTLKDYSKGPFVRFAGTKRKARFKNKQFELQWTNINKFFKYWDSMYFVKCAAGLGSTEGAIYKFDIKKKGGFTSEVADLHNDPYAILVDHDNVFIATYNRFYVFNKWKKTLELDDLFWKNLNPNNIVIADKRTVYVGHTGGFTKIDLKTKKLTLYKYVKP